MSRSRRWCGFCDNKLDHDENQTCPNVTCARCGVKGHYGVNCIQITCERCLQHGHNHSYCSNSPRCKHCQGYHLSTQCPKIAEAKEREAQVLLAKTQQLAKDAQEAKIKADQETTKIKDELEQVVDTTICIICKDKPRLCVALPCRHFLYCQDCLDKIPICAKCRTPIKERMALFL